MDDASLVRGLECIGDLASHRKRFIERNRPTRDTVGERRTVNQFQHERLRTIGILDAMNLRDVWMIQ